MSQSDGDPVVETRKLTKRYGDFVALDALDLTLNRGQILGYIGPNGAGKTTTIKILVGLARATSGEAYIAGHDCSQDVRQIKRLVGYMPDTFGGYENMRVREYLDFFGAAFGIRRKDRARRIEQVMEITGTGYMRDMYTEALSHGMKQRVGIARTLIHDPQVLILDEPANGLDPSARIEMRQVLMRLAEMGKTLIVTSHILPELSRICDVVGIVTGGKLRAFGTLGQIMHEVRQRRVIQADLLRHDQVEPMADLLRRKLGDAGEVTPSPTEAEVRFGTTWDDDQLSGLLAEAVGEGIRITGFSEVPLDLEDAFLEVTGLRGETAERADGKTVGA